MRVIRAPEARVRESFLVRSHTNAGALSKPMRSPLIRRDYFTLVINSLQSLSKSSKKDGLAYLVVTSKPESAIRDRLAFRLQQSLGIQRTVARELSSEGGGTRVDIAILNEQDSEEVVIQLKVRTAATLQVPKKLRKEARKDLKKCKKHQAGRCLYLLLAPLIETPWDEAIPALDKAIVFALRKPMQDKEVDVLKENAKKNIKEAFPSKAWKVKGGRIRAGKAYGASVSVLYWLCEKRNA